MGDYNNVWRKAFIGGLGLIPEAGPFLSLFADILLPDGSDTDPVADLRTKVDQMDQQIRDEDWLTDLQGYLNDLTAELKIIADPKRQSDHLMAYQALYTRSNECAPYFLDPVSVRQPDDQPQNTVPLLVAYGTIRIGVLRDRVFNYQAIMGTPPTD